MFEKITNSWAGRSPGDDTTRGTIWYSIILWYAMYIYIYIYGQLLGVFDSKPTIMGEHLLMATHTLWWGLQLSGQVFQQLFVSVILRASGFLLSKREWHQIPLNNRILGDRLEMALFRKLHEDGYLEMIVLRWLSKGWLSWDGRLVMAVPTKPS